MAVSSSSSSMLALEPEYTSVSKSNSLIPQNQSRSSSHGPVAILWDIENCPVPSDVRPEDVAGNIRMALRVHPVIEGAVTLFSAYGDFNVFPRRLREGCQRTGVKLIDVPNGRKDAADKAILVDMFLFALDNPPPSSILLISGDVDFAPALHILGQRGYTVILVLPSGVGVSSALSNAGRFIWDWPSVARGEGFVPSSKPSIPCSEITGRLMGCEITDCADCQTEEESIVYRGILKNRYNMRDFSMVSQSLSGYSSNLILMAQNPASARSHCLPYAVNEDSAGSNSSVEQNGLSWVQPGDLNGLKGQLIRLLELWGGSLPLTRLSAEYQKLYGRPLYISEYGALKLVDLLKKMADAIIIEGKGQRRIVCLRSSKVEPNGPPIILARKDKKGKEPHENTVDVMAGAGSSDEFSDDDRIVNGGEKLNLEVKFPSQVIDESLNKFKYELQEILVSYSCRVFLGYFEAIYQQRYKKVLDYMSFGVNDLEELLHKVKDVVLVQEEPTSKKKFLVAVGG